MCQKAAKTGSTRLHSSTHHHAKSLYSALATLTCSADLSSSWDRCRETPMRCTWDPGRNWLSQSPCIHSMWASRARPMSRCCRSRVQIALRWRLSRWEDEKVDQNEIKRILTLFFLIMLFANSLLVVLIGVPTTRNAMHGDVLRLRMWGPVETKMLNIFMLIFFLSHKLNYLRQFAHPQFGTPNSPSPGVPAAYSWYSRRPSTAKIADAHRQRF